MTIVKAKINVGGVHFDNTKSRYRGSVNYRGIKYRTKYYESERAAKLALSKLKKQLVGLSK